MAAAQAVDLREGLTLAPGTGAIYAAVRAHVSMLKDDRPLGADAEVFRTMLANGTWRGAPDDRIKDRVVQLFPSALLMNRLSSAESICTMCFSSG